MIRRVCSCENECIYAYVKYPEENLGPKKQFMKSTRIRDRLVSLRHLAYAEADFWYRTHKNNPQFIMYENDCW